ncbi:MAG: TonB family protein [Acidobacteriota bacterium]
MTQEEFQRLTVPPPPPSTKVGTVSEAASGFNRQTRDLSSTPEIDLPRPAAEPPRSVARPTAPVSSPVSAPTSGPAAEGRRTVIPPAPLPPKTVEPAARQQRPSPFAVDDRRDAPPLPVRGELNFAIPESGSLLSRLTASLRNIGEIRQSNASGTTAGTGFQFLLQEDSLRSRIAREFRAAGEEFRRDPRRFLVEVTRGEGTNLRRRNLLLAGSEMAIVGFVTLYFGLTAVSSASRASSWSIRGLIIAFALYLLGCYLVRGMLLFKLINQSTRRIVVPKVVLEIANWAPLAVILLLSVLLTNNYNLYCAIFPGRCVPQEKPIEELALLTPLTEVPNEVDNLKIEKSATVKERKVGGSLNKPKAASGGGGGGRNAPTPPSKGVPPPMALTPQIVMPNPEPPKIKDPSLAVMPTVYGDPRALPPMKGPIGDPMGVPAPPSSGPGSGAGIGRGTGTGVGGGEGGGAGQGRGGNFGGGDMGLGGGRTVEPMSASLRPTILYKEKAKYTEEARQNKIQGTVVLNVVFTADGRITNIRVVRGLPDGLTEKAIEAAQRIRFNPAVKAGVPVSVRGNLEFTFNLY